MHYDDGGWSEDECVYTSSLKAQILQYFEHDPTRQTYSIWEMKLSLLLVILAVVAVDQSQAQGIFGNFFSNFFSNLNNPQRSRSSSSRSVSSTLTSTASTAAAASLTSAQLEISTTTKTEVIESTVTQFSFLTETVFNDIVSNCIFELRISN